MQRIASSCNENSCTKNAKGETTEKKKSPRELWKWRGCGKRGKPKAGFPLFPQPLGNLAKPRRDSHIPTAPTTTPWKSGKPKAGFPLSHRDLLSSKTERKTGGLRPPPRTAALRSASANDVYHSVTLFREATRPGDLIVADHSRVFLLSCARICHYLRPRPAKRSNFIFRGDNKDRSPRVAWGSAQLA